MNIDDWVAVRTNKKEIQGIVSKVNSKTFWVRIQIAGKYSYIKRRNSDLIEILG